MKSLFKTAFQSMYKLQGVAPRSVRIEAVEDLVVINFKNTFEEGLDPDCATLLNIFLQLVVPYGLRYSFHYATVPESNKIEHISIIIEQREYAKLDNVFKES
ncbi:hypothetical protein MM326_09730 [Alkalihalobacillus sp. LMS6]|uniref:hypothetical protein n=1 Tax=Alkalihalobacillus sp. LMS6 TaxID=2924034 RepID=UPI0020D0ABCC|nr:hypothetical protein [Alkalihalobacillus sp. LMS6]UTR08270.1 hypothetical protein MM326_09730 [Alkalihalobacillus sp. LMS6]